LSDFFTEIEWLLHDKPVRDFDYYYDQIVCLGELLSSCIVSNYLNEVNIINQWIDVRDSIRTNNNFRDADIDWSVTTEKIRANVLSLMNDENKIIVTQGYIGATDDNESTTLGREGSDYSAAIFANVLNAESLCIWKDVDGVMNADPKTYPDAVLIDELSYTEVIEMAYYGAQVIHPKTIKPLQNKHIPLLVKSFLNSTLPGTIIHQKKNKNLPPIIVIKNNQVLIELKTQDFSFVGEEPIIQLYQLFKQLHIKPNLIQTAAISVFICMDDKFEKIEQLALKASDQFDVQIEKGLSLLTIRHYTQDVLAKLSETKNKVLQQQSNETVQVLYR
jgi:aspartate kinase